MPEGYVRQSAASIVNGLNITAPPINAEFDKVQSAFHASTGHNHDGTTGGGAPISLTGGVSGVLPIARGGTGGINNLTATTNPGVGDDSADSYAVGSIWVNVTLDRVFICADASSGAAVWAEVLLVKSDNIQPGTTATVDIGTTGVRFKDLYLSGIVNSASGTSIFNNVTINGTLDMNSGTSSTITGLSAPTSSSDAVTKAYVDTAISNLIASAPGALDTLNELAAAIGNDADYATTVTNALAGKLALSGGIMSGNIDLASAHKIVNGVTPTASGDLTTKGYVDGILGSATSAAASAAAAAASLDSFDDRYLGAKSSDPTLDNDGDALLTGALYFNTVSDALFVYDGAAWQAAALDAGAFVPASRTLTAGTGLTGGGDLSADRTLALDGQALALHNLGTSGVIARTGAGTVAGRTITGTTNQITVTNGDGVSGNPTLALNVGTGANQIVQLNGSGRLPALNGSLLTDVVAGAAGMQIFTVSGTWTPDTAGKYLIIATGAGGGGRSGTSAGAGGGGAGGTCISYIGSSSGSYTVTIGAGGGPSSSGGTTIISGTGITLSAQGGGGSTSTYGDAGGTPSGGALNINGADGTDGSPDVGGAGGGSFWGSGSGSTVAGGTAGHPGEAYGAGGSGSPGGTAGSGMQGVVMIIRLL